MNMITTIKNWFKKENNKPVLASEFFNGMNKTSKSSFTMPKKPIRKNISIADMESPFTGAKGKIIKNV